MIEQITSIKDERIRLAREVKTRKGREVHQRMLLEGEQIIDWALDHGVEVEFVLCTPGSDTQIRKKVQAAGLAVYQVSDGIQKKVTGTSYLIPVVGVGKIPDMEKAEQPGFVLVLDDVKDFGNLGTIIRTGSAFGVEDVISTTSDFDLFQRKTIEASRGTVFSARVRSFEAPSKTMDFLHQQGYQIIATGPRGDHLQSLVELDDKPIALVIGNESRGISKEIEDQADFLVQIPMSHSVESLNVGVAAGISVYELRLKQVLTMIEEQIKSTLGRELNVAGMLVQQALDAELKKVTDLSSQQVIFMMVLKCDQKMTVSAMCRQFGILSEEVEGFLAPLISQGLVVGDQELTLTVGGEEILSKLWFTVEKTEGEILSQLPNGEALALRKNLRVIQEQCVNMMGEREDAD